MKMCGSDKIIICVYIYIRNEMWGYLGILVEEICYLEYVVIFKFVF